MKYQVAYYSRTGNSEKLAKGIMNTFTPQDATLVDLAKEDVSRDANTYILCFGMVKGEIPIRIIDALDRLDGKTVLFLVTCGRVPSDDYRRYIMQRIDPFLPDNCESLDLYLCSGAFSKELYDHAVEKLRLDPENTHARAAVERYEAVAGHPDEDDIVNANMFLRKTLRLKQTAL